MVKNLHKILLVLLLFIAVLHGIQFVAQPFEMKRLRGAVSENPFPEFSTTAYWNASYQLGFTRYLNNHFGFRPLFIRWYNQMEYTFFGKSGAENIVVGKNYFLFEANKIKSYYGEDFIGKSRIRQNVLKLQRIQYYLEQHNTQVLILIAPNKVYFYPEKLPSYIKQPTLLNNYNYYKEVLDTSKLQVMDVNAWFLKIQPEMPFALMPKTAAHWSEYGAMLVADSLLRLMGNLIDKPLDYFLWSDTIVATPRGTDNDLAQLLNVFDPPKDSAYIYPTYFVKQGENPYKPKALFIGDSFFWNLYYNRQFNPAFKSLRFWYYNSSVYPQYGDEKYQVKDLDVMHEVTSREFVVLVSSTTNLLNLGYGFIDEVNRVLIENNEEKIMAFAHEYEDRIRNSEKQMKLIREKAIKRSITVDSMISVDARYLAEKKYNRLFNVKTQLKEQ